MKFYNLSLRKMFVLLELQLCVRNEVAAFINQKQNDILFVCYVVKIIISYRIHKCFVLLCNTILSQI